MVDVHISTSGGCCIATHDGAFASSDRQHTKIIFLENAANSAIAGIRGSPIDEDRHSAQCLWPRTLDSCFRAVLYESK
jgi:hypothetical protein